MSEPVELDQYYVALCKYGEPIYTVAGPFGLWDLADEWMTNNPLMDGGGCSHQVVKTTISVE